MKLIKPMLILSVILCILIAVYSIKLSPYEPKQAIANGDVVAVHGEITNLDKLEDFIDKVHNKKKEKITVTTYTIEGDAIIQTLKYNGKNIQYDVDMRRDNFAAEEDRKIEKYEFSDIEKETDGEVITYVLYNKDKTSKMDVLEIDGENKDK